MFPLNTRLDALAASPRLQMEVFGHADGGEETLPLRAFAFGDPSLPRIYVAAGVHGDEPEGVEATLQLLEALAAGASPVTRHYLVVLPCLNPSGLARGTRVNALRQDINRQFHANALPTPAAVRRFLQPAPAAVLIDLHSDSAAQGFYCFELLQPDAASQAAPILARLTQQGYTLEAVPFYAGCVGVPGLIAPTPAEMEDFARLAPGASLSQWGWQNGIPRSYVFETPQGAGFDAGVAMHREALAALFAALED